MIAVDWITYPIHKQRSESGPDIRTTATPVTVIEPELNAYIVSDCIRTVELYTININIISYSFYSRIAS